MHADLRRRALAPLLLGFVGPVPPRWLLDALADGAGGVVLFASNLDGDIGALTERLRTAAGRDVLIALDEEGGDVTRLDARTGSAAPGAAALGHRDDPAATRATYRRIGDRLAAVGVTVDLAPVADVNTDPDNPVIGVRSFSAEPERAARHVAAAVTGLQDAGIAACAKHFPGHGATRNDSHHEVATVTGTREQLAESELVPFLAAIGAGSRAVMTGHLAVPSLDPDHLATVSRAITTDLLRGELGFTGTVLTDALEMQALAGTVGMTQGYVHALVAGADAIETGAREYPELVDEVVAAVEKALTNGTLGPARLEDAGRRTALLAVVEPPRPTPSAADPFAVEVLGTLPELVAPVVIECRPPGGMASGELPWSLARPLSERIPGVEVMSEPVRTGRAVVVVVRDPQRHPWQRALLDDVRECAGGPLVVVDVGWPAEPLPGVPTVRTRGVAPGLLARAADVLAGHAR